MSIRSRCMSLTAALALLAPAQGALAAPAPSPATTPVPVAASAHPAAATVAPAPAPAHAATVAPAPAKTTARAAARTPARRTTRRPAATRPSAASADSGASTATDSTMKLRGGQEGTAFRTLTIEGEDRIRMDYERPVLDLDLDPAKADGLDPGSARDVLDRTTPDASIPLLALTAREPSPYLARPWLGHIATGAVARFRPDVKGVESWSLVVADSRGGQVASFAGRGDPPREITWDGRARDGNPARPGLTYSYVFQARDRAGNKRNFVGNGFQIPAYRIESPKGLLMMIPGEDLGATPVRPTTGAVAAPAPVTFEVASWLNQLASPTARIQITAVARTQDRANALASGMARDLGRLVLGDPARLSTAGTVEPDAPAGGTVRIEASR